MNKNCGELDPNSNLSGFLISKKQSYSTSYRQIFDMNFAFTVDETEIFGSQYFIKLLKDQKPDISRFKMEGNLSRFFQNAPMRSGKIQFFFAFFTTKNKIIH